MASYFPEGECFFRRSSLVYPGWNAENEANFYSHVLVEYYWNGWVFRNDANAASQSTHPRSRLITNRAQGTGTHARAQYSVWDRFCVIESRTRAMRQTFLTCRAYTESQNFNECRDRSAGGPLKYILRPIPITDRRTEWLWIDGTIPLRAIYFPVCHKSDEAFQEYCTYVVIDFRARQSATMANENINSPHRVFNTTPQHGLSYRRHITWGFNAPNIITYLTLPRQVRNPEQGLFRTHKRGDELVVGADFQVAWLPTSNAVFHREMDLAKIVSATFGIEVGWRPYAYSSFIIDILVKLTDLALGFVPGVGPLLSFGFGFGLALQLIQDPESFQRDNILDLGAAILETLINSATSSGQKYMAPGLLPGPGSRSTKFEPDESLTDEERKARKEAGEALNARLTKLVNEVLEGRDPPQSPAWLDRIADAERTAFIADPDSDGDEDINSREGSEEAPSPGAELK